MAKSSTRYTLSSLERRFESAWLAWFPDITLVRQHQFHPTRRWRFDYVAAYSPIAIELQGGIYSNGAHSRATGQKKDMEKANHAAALGWFVFYLHTDNVTDRDALQLIADTIIQLTNVSMP